MGSSGQEVSFNTTVGGVVLLKDMLEFVMQGFGLISSLFYKHQLDVYQVFTSCNLSIKPIGA